jgi:nitroimidazol reductase NimA-like FMN-containing flavoprotein (pyridoxamine 5'-phosphate oxidase superfamily)
VLETLSTKECWDLLGTQGVGRVAYTEHALPKILPVNYSLVDRHLLLRLSAAGLARWLDRQVVAFEVDEVDRLWHGGWSVVVIGTARALTSVSDATRGLTVPASWAGPDHQALVTITVGDIQGRRLHGELDSRLDAELVDDV